jgi:zinc protease
VATLVGNRILGGEFLSRLNQNLREKNGFTYGAGSGFRYGRTGGAWVVSTSVRTDATAPALREVISELDGLAGDRPFTTDEVATALGSEAKSYPDTFESPSSIAGALLELARFGLPEDELKTFLARLEATDEARVRAEMGQVVASPRRLVLVVGDRAKVQPELEKAGFRVKLTTLDELRTGGEGR